MRAIELRQALVLVENIFQSHRIGDLATFDQACAGLVNTGVNGIEEVAGFKKVGDFLKGAVVHQDGPQKRLLRLDIVGRLAKLGGRRDCLERRYIGNDFIADHGRRITDLRRSCPLIRPTGFKIAA